MYCHNNAVARKGGIRRSEGGRETVTPGLSVCHLPLRDMKFWMLRCSVKTAASSQIEPKYNCQNGSLTGPQYVKNAKVPILYCCKIR